MPTPAAPLPQDAVSLLEIRDSLAGYLAALDDRAARHREWLQSQEALVLVAHHRVSQLVGQGLERDAIYTTELLGEVAGIVLATGGLDKLARKSFGANTDMLRPRALIPARFTENIIPPDLPDGLIPVPVVAPEPETAAPEKPWWKPDWMKKKPEAPAESPHAARQRRRQEWQDAQDEITSLQSDRHYYIDSLMDWVGDSLASNGAQDAQMQGYQNPKRIAELATRDHAVGMLKNVAELQQSAVLYTDIATMLDEQRITEFAAMLPELFAKPDTAIARTLRETLLQDYHSVSFAEIALTKVAHRDDQLLLFRAALEVEPELKFTGLKKRGEILDRIREETEKKHKPLSDKALRLARKKLDAMDEAREDGVKRRRPQPVTLSDLFNAAVDAIEEALIRRKSAAPAPRR
ncbi:MAG: hypothetical protein PSY14_00585 [bacterium]|nr:hypothetical protein [bacterium]